MLPTGRVVVRRIVVGVIAQVDGQGGVVGVDGDDLTGVGAAGGIRWPATMITPLLATRRWIRTGAREGLG